MLFCAHLGGQGLEQRHVHVRAYQHAGLNYRVGGVLCTHLDRRGLKERRVVEHIYQHAGLELQQAALADLAQRLPQRLQLCR